jgi:hypothetical protein
LSCNGVVCDQNDRSIAGSCKMKWLRTILEYWRRWNELS